ncbi:MAG: Asp-tRNA(Asn)/Glu-tRNA(Gln) amidotransferase GatCAB subunit B, partial [Oscillospiraceae bacterium]|nr:Asp-tRNA(Asn)/Glu-tRNA(Gln) amidotransferase GatCAB subunit B [Oscillospiraceae bacterium]
RYFPEPDLLPIEIDEGWLGSVRRSLPELAHHKRKRYIDDFGLSEFEASVLTNHKKISDLFEDVSKQSNEPVESARLITGEIMRLVNATNTLPEDLSVDGRKLALLIPLVLDGKINRNAYKEAVQAVFTADADPEAYIVEKGMMMVSDGNVVTEAVAAVIAEHADAVADYRSGKEKAFGFLMGQAMKRLGKAGNPEMVKLSLKKLLRGN